MVTANFKSIADFSVSSETVDLVYEEIDTLVDIEKISVYKLKNVNTLLFCEKETSTPIFKSNYKRYVDIINIDLFNKYFAPFYLNANLVNKVFDELIDTFKNMKLVYDSDFSNHEKLFQFIQSPVSKNTSLLFSVNDSYLYSDFFEKNNYPLCHLSKYLIIHEGKIKQKINLNAFKKIIIDIISKENNCLILFTSDKYKPSIVSMSYNPNKHQAGDVICYYIAFLLEKRGIKTSLCEVFNKDVVSMYEMVTL